jgi:hypothetical protein
MPKNNPKHPSYAHRGGTEMAKVDKQKADQRQNHGNQSAKIKQRKT